VGRDHRGVAAVADRDGQLDEQVAVGLQQAPTVQSRFAARAASARTVIASPAGVKGSWTTGAPPRYAGTSALIPVSARPMISFWICEVPS
jgi:hypothetical protein